MITQEEAVTHFKNLLAMMTSWVRVASSQFAEHVAVFMHWSLEQALWAVERAKQEFFFTTALNDSSIMAHAETKEYLPRKRVPASGTVRITNTGSTSLSIPENTACLSAPQLAYILEPVNDIHPGASAEVVARQMSYQQMQVVVAAQQPFLEILLSKEDSRGLVNLRVYVDGVEWVRTRMFRNTTAESLAYDEFFTHMGQTGVRFGNGNFGAMPAMGSVVTVDYWTTEGVTTLIEGQQLYPAGDLFDDAYQPASLTIETVTAITGGAEAEGIKEMQSNLHYWQLYNDKLIWDDDYAFFLKNKAGIPNIRWIKCWGEQQQEAETGYDVQNINRIFISAYATGAVDLEGAILAALADIPLLNRKFTFVAPDFATFAIAVTGVVARTVLPAVAAAGIRQVLEDAYGKDSPTRKTAVAYSDCYELIRATGYFDGAGASFQVVITGVTAPTNLKEMVHLDPNPLNNPITLTVAR